MTQKTWVEELEALRLLLKDAPKDDAHPMECWNFISELHRSTSRIRVRIQRVLAQVTIDKANGQR